jgi:CubicO group peptidase (beta-lactamase class C family)
MDARAQWTGLDAGRLERIGDHLQRDHIDTGRLAGCQIAVARHGHLAYAKSFGLMDRERAKPVAEDAIWRIYSMSKPITSVALMTLYERGLFQLDDRVEKFVPSWRGQRVWVSGLGADMITEPARRPATIRDLLSHTAGLTYGGLLGPDAELPIDAVYKAEGVRGRHGTESMGEFLAKLGRIPLAFQPGSAWLYSLATDACGALVELISGRPFADFLADEIFAPLGMKDTGFQVPPAKLDRLSANYRQQPDGTSSLEDDPAASAYAREPGFKSGGGGLVSTTADYLRFCEMLRRGGELDGARILGPRTVELMRHNHLEGGRDIAAMTYSGDVVEVQPGVGFGLGFATSLGAVESGGLGAADYYWGGAASTIFWVDPKEDLSVVFMTQLMPCEMVDFRGPLKNIIYSAIVE